MKALNEPRQQWRNWTERNTVGRAGVKIHETTGADITWLLTGKGDPFPHGLIRYTDTVIPPAVLARIEHLEAASAEIGVVLSLMIRACAKVTPATAEELLGLLSSAQQQMGQDAGAVLVAALHAARAAQTSAAASLPAAALRDPNEKPPRSSH